MPSKRHKGAAFEREVCVALSLWVTNGKRRDVFWRTAMSGGRATVHNRAGNIVIRQGGDICAHAPEGNELCERFFFETKFYRDLELHRFILFNEGKLAKFWKRACVDARAHSRSPVLIARENRTPTMLIVPGISPLNKVPPLAAATRAMANLYSFDDAARPAHKRAAMGGE